MGSKVTLFIKSYLHKKNLFWLDWFKYLYGDSFAIQLVDAFIDMGVRTLANLPLFLVDVFTII